MPLVFNAAFLRGERGAGRKTNKASLFRQIGGWGIEPYCPLHGTELSLEPRQGGGGSGRHQMLAFFCFFYGVARPCFDGQELLSVLLIVSWLLTTLYRQR